MRVLNAEEIYDALTAARVAAEQDGDNDSAQEINTALDALNPFAVGYIATELAKVGVTA